jgi:UDPglucose--hexose-1-phosphate uridylyltransferase
MSEWRRDPLTDRWVIIAPVRGDRPEELLERPAAINRSLPCPFCVGHEHLTPNPTLVVPFSDDESNWMIRVVPNKYPAVRAEPNRRRQTHPNHPLFECQSIRGGHEVIIESPVHLQSITELSPQHVIAVFQSYAERLRYWYAQKEIAYAMVFKNVGGAAGASLRHLHSQLVATCVEPPAVTATGGRLTTYRRQMGGCLLCDMIHEELSQSRRIVFSDDRLVAYCPFASYLPYLVRIAPVAHQDAFEEQSHNAVGEVALLVRRMVSLFESIYRDVAYNFVIQTRPALSGGPASFHWWIDMFPRVTKLAGFEWGSGGMINPIAPERAAAELQSVDRHFHANQHVEDFSG